MKYLYLKASQLQEDRIIPLELKLWAMVEGKRIIFKKYSPYSLIVVLHLTIMAKSGKIVEKLRLVLYLQLP